MLVEKDREAAEILVSGPEGTAVKTIKAMLRKAAAPGPGPGSTAGEDEDEDVRATIKKRAPCSVKYAVHLTAPASPPYKEAATVAVHCPGEDRRTHVNATVVYHDKDKDVAILEVQRELAAPVLDTGDFCPCHAAPTSHGMVAATELDALSHIRGDITSGKGDSGGGCFSVATGKLMAMVVGSDETTKKAIMVPIAVISSILTDLAAQRRLREQPPGCAAC
ncbi:hypothetical protein HYH02_004392 [Chlamydomonas schloesseri]|uniref:Peptidase S1 domain-containing protein n=1 Tax=Chlamydomonas schloesseri TaxID=2026947 RepID=A0A835WNL9_9CHLO|nr:hypothetical protein HYH02_004392 [Chlamydomonas schloesseri]|eukprot:KAG2451124.1 hypothetical protein HYH02_004392 [Chlamydomonas schloesseri]